MPAIIYPANIKTDKDKLFACYSLIEQMHLEHNRVATLARSNPDKYLKTGKFSAYAQESKIRLKLLLAEQNHLKENIRWANYTSEQWKAVSKLSLEEQGAIYQTLFGKKSAERGKLTKATSTELDELKALNLDDMPEKLGADPTEDFTTYTEYDEGSDITKTADRITFTAAESRYDTFYVDKDKGVDHFNGNFEHLEKHQISAFANNAVAVTWLMANAVADMAALRAANANYLSYYHYRSDAAYYLYIEERDGASMYSDRYNNFALSTVYYVEIERDEGVGTYGTIYARICTGDYYGNGGSLVDTLTVTLHTSKKDFRYIYGLTGYDDNLGTNFTVTGYVELLDLQEAVVPTAGILAATNIGSTTARINGKITDDGGESCEARFRWRQKKTLYEYYNTGDDIGLSIYGDKWKAQTLTPSEDHKNTKVKLKLYRVGEPGIITVSIKATSEHFPTGDDLCVGTTNGNTLTTDSAGEWREIILGSGYNLLAETQYAIVVRALDGDSDNKIQWKADSSSPTYAGGEYCLSSDGGDSWQRNTLYDFMFEDWAEFEWTTTEWQNTLETDDEYHEDLADLEPGTEYEFQTQAKNSAGEGEWSESEEFETLIGQPTMRRWGGSILPVGAQRIGKGW